MPGEAIPPVPGIRTIRPNIPKPVAAVIERMLAPNPDDRQATPAEVATELEPFTAKSNLPQLALAAASDTPPNLAYIPSKFRRRTRRFAITAMILVGVALAGFAITVQTDKGQLVIESSDDNIEVVVKRSGKLYDSLDALEVGKGKNHWSFRSGSYEVQLVGETDGLRVEGGTFTLMRGGKSVVTISREGATKTIAAAGPVYDGKTFNEWIRLIQDEKWAERRIEGLRALAALGRGEHVKQAVATIIETGSDPAAVFTDGEQQELTETAIQALVRIGPDDALSPLLAAATAKDVKKRRFALQALSHFDKTDEVIAKGREAVSDTDGIVRKHAAILLNEKGVLELARLLEKDVDVNVRRQAVTLLRFMGKKAQPALPAILAAMTDVDEQVRREALKELRVLYPTPKMLEPVLIKALNSKNPQIRREVGVRVLEAVSNQGRAAIPVCIAVLEKTDLGGSSAVKERGRNTEIAPLWNLIRGLRDFGPDAHEALPLLKKRLKHEDESIRNVAAEAIKKISGEAVPVSSTRPVTSAWPAAIARTSKTPQPKTEIINAWFERLKKKENTYQPSSVEGLNEADRRALYVIDVSSGEVALVADEPAPGLIHIGTPAWSADGSRIVFDATPGKNYRKTRMKMLDLTQTEAKYTDLGLGNCPSLSPDGTRLAYHLNSNAALGSVAGLWVQNIDGSKREHLGEGGFPNWTLDANNILLSSFREPTSMTLVDVELGVRQPLKSEELKFLSKPSLTYGRGGLKLGMLGDRRIVAVTQTSHGSGIALLTLKNEYRPFVNHVLWRSSESLDMLPTCPLYNVDRGYGVFIGETAQGRALYFITRNGLFPPKRLESGPQDNRLSSLAMSPDGRYVLFCSDRILPKSLQKPAPSATFRHQRESETAVYEGRTLKEWIAQTLPEKSETLRNKAIAAIEVLGVHNPAVAIRGLIQIGCEYNLIDSPNKQGQDLRIQTIKAIQKLSENRIPQTLIDAFDDPDVNIRRFASTQLSLNWNVAPPISLARKATKDSDAEVRRRTMEWLVRHGAAAIPELIKSFDDEASGVRRAAVFAVLSLGNNRKLTPEHTLKIQPKLYHMLHDRAPAVRHEVLRTLTTVATDENKLIASLTEAVSDPDNVVKYFAIRSLGYQGPKAKPALPALIKLLTTQSRTEQEEKSDDGSWLNRSHRHPTPQLLITTLGKIGPAAKDAVPLIKEFHQHEHPGVRGAVVTAVKQITGEVIKLPGSKAKRQKQASNTTGAVYDGRSFDDWLAVLKSERKTDRLAEAFTALGLLRQKNRDREAADAIIHAMRQYDTFVQDMDKGKLIQASAATFKKLERPTVIAALSHELQHGTVNGKLFTIWAMWNGMYYVRDDSPNNPFFTHALKAAESEDWRLRLMALQEIGAYPNHPKVVIERHVQALQHKRREIREQATHYLVTAQPDTPELLPALIKLLKIEKPPQGSSFGGGGGLGSGGGFGGFLADVRVTPLRQLAKLGEKAAPAVPAIMELLKDKNFGAKDLYSNTNRPPTRQQAIITLGAIGPAAVKAVPVLRTQLQHEHDPIRKAATAALEKITGKKVEPNKPKPSPPTKSTGAVYDGRTFDQWIALLKRDKSAQRRVEGIKALAAMHTEGNVQTAVSTIIKIGGEHSRDRMLKDDRDIVNLARSELSRIGRERIVQQLIKSLDSEDVQVRRFASNMLMSVKLTELMIPPVLKLARDPDETVRLNSTYMLSNAGDQGFLALVTLLEKDQSSTIRQRAARALGQLKEIAPKAVPPLMAALLSDAPEVRAAAFRALRIDRTNEKSTFKPDQKLLNKTLLKFVEAGIPLHADRSSIQPFELVDPTSPEALPAVLAGMTSEIFRVRSGASYVLGHFNVKPETMIPALITALKDDKMRYKKALLDKLSSYGPQAKAAMPTLIKLYKTSDDRTRSYLLLAYEKIDLFHKDVQPLLREAARSDDQKLANQVRDMVKRHTKQKPPSKPIEHTPPDALTLHINAAGKPAVDGILLSDADLKKRLVKNVAAVGKQGLVVLIKADPKAPAAAVLRVIRACGKSGARSVALDGTIVAPPRGGKEGAAVYDGKTLDEWLALLRTEKNPLKRVEMLTPIKTLGAEEPEKVIPILIDVAGEYDISAHLYQDPEYHWDGQTIYRVRENLDIVDTLVIAILELSKNNVPNDVVETLSDKRINHRRLAFHLIRHLRALYDAESPKERTIALKDLRPHLQKGISDADVSVRHEAIAALYENFEDAPSDFLLETLKSSEEFILQRLALKILGARLGIRLSFDEWNRPNDDFDISAFRKALDAKAVAEFKREPDNELKLISALKNEPYIIQSGVLFLLIKLKTDPKQLIPFFMKELNAKVDDGKLRRDRVLQNALFGLGEIGAEGSTAVPKLVKMLKEYQTEFVYENGNGLQTNSFNQDDIERLIIESLGKIGPAAKAAIPAIQVRLKYSRKETRKAAELAIKQITGKDPATTK